MRSTSGSTVYFPIPTAASAPAGITPGSDGAMWFTEHDANKIGRIAPDGTLTEYSSGLPQYTWPASIISGSDGNLYFGGDCGCVGIVSTSGSITSIDVPFQGGCQPNPSDLSAGPNKMIWFADNGCDSIGYLSASVPPSLYPNANMPSGEPHSIVTGADGNLWFMTGSLIIRMNLDGTYTQYPIPGGSIGSDMVAGLDGNLWFTDTWAGIGKVTTSGTFTMFSSGVPGGNSLTVGTDGALWFAGIGEIGRITTQGAITHYVLAPLPNGSQANVNELASDRNGNIWFTTLYGNVIGEFSPAAAFDDRI